MLKKKRTIVKNPNRFRPVKFFLDMNWNENERNGVQCVASYFRFAKRCMPCAVEWAEFEGPSLQEPAREGEREGIELDGAVCAGNPQLSVELDRHLLKYTEANAHNSGTHSETHGEWAMLEMPFAVRC